MNTTYSMKQSTVAMRKRMSDDTNKYNFNRKRILDRIREGSIPQQKTTKKYDISTAEVNAIRKEGNHPPLVVAFAPSGANGAWLTGSKEFLTVSTPFTPFVISLLIRPFGKADIVVVLLYYIARLFSVIVFFTVGFS